MLALPAQGRAPGRLTGSQQAVLPAETTHSSWSTSERYTQKTRTPRSRSGSVSEHFSLKRLRTLFFRCAHPGKTTAALLTKERAKPASRLLGFGLGCPNGSCVLSPCRGMAGGGKAFQEHPRVLWEGLANNCWCVRWPGRARDAQRLAACGLVGTTWRGWSCLREEVCSRNRSESVSAGLCTHSVHLLL